VYNVLYKIRIIHGKSFKLTLLNYKWELIPNFLNGHIILYGKGHSYYDTSKPDSAPKPGCVKSPD